MKIVKVLKITSQSTGEEKILRTMQEAALFLERSTTYVQNKIRENKLGENPKGEKFKIEVIGTEPAILSLDFRKQRYQPCETCKKCYGGCSWTECINGKVRFEPVEGWDATPIYYGKELYSYQIHNCPEYESDISH